MSQTSDRPAWASLIGSPTSIVVSIPLLIIALLYLESIAKTNKRSKLGERAPPVPSWLPFRMDNGIMLIRSITNNSLLEMAQRVLQVPGRTVEIRMGANDIVWTDNPENIRAILSTKGDCFGKGETYHNIWKSLMRDSILTTDGAQWHQNRQYLLPHVAKVRPTDYAITNRHAQRLMEVLSDGRQHDMLDELNRFAIDAVSNIFYGTSTYTLGSSDQSLRDAIQKQKDVNTWRLAFGKLGSMIPPDRKAVAVIDDYLNKVIREFSADEGDEEDRKAQTMLGSLIKQGVSEKELKDQLVAVLVGGRDSVAITITWALFELVRHPDVLDQLREEVTSSIGANGTPNPSQLEGMELLNGVLQETMRLHASVGFNTRTALKDCSLPTGGGPNGTSPVSILAGSQVVTAFDSVHRRLEFWGSDANEFVPTRWSKNWRPDPWHFYPFNRGTRICLGKSLAVMEVKFVLCRLVQAFSHIELVEEVDGKVVVVDAAKKEMKTKLAFNTKPAEIVWLRFGR